MTNPNAAVIKDGDRSFELRIDACRVFLGGEFAGNIEIDVACPADAVARAFDCLRVQVPGEPPSDMALGNGAYAPGVQLICSGWRGKSYTQPVAMAVPSTSSMTPTTFCTKPSVTFEMRREPP